MLPVLHENRRVEGAEVGPCQAEILRIWNHPDPYKAK
jgi:hypothetical protein